MAWGRRTFSARSTNETHLIGYEALASEALASNLT